MRTHTRDKEDLGTSEPILATKLLVPRPRPDLVSRPRLLARLDEGLDCRLTVVSASAGFGKTMLLGEWCASLRDRNTPVVWLSLDEDDNDPTRLWVYLIRTLGALKEGLAEDVLSLLVSPSRPPLETVITTLINALSSIEEDFVLILDDYHVIVSESIHDSLAFLIEHEPPQMHLVVAGRTDPPLPLARLRGSGQLAELGVADLRFTLPESAEFLQRTMNFTPSGEDVAVLHGRTEGWVAGLQMAVLSMRGPEEAGAAYIASFAGDDRNVKDYLLEEVLLKQPGAIQDFLLKTSVLDRVSGPLCDALTGRADGQETLETLERANLFIASLDTKRQWYRYHRLFLDLLRQRLAQTAPDEIPVLHLRAAHWYADHDLLDEALGHGMASGDFQQLVQLLDRAGWPMLMHGEVNLLLECLEALPEEMVRSRPRLSLYHAWALLRATQFDEVEQRLNDAEKGLGTEQGKPEEGAGESPLQVRSMLGAVAALRASLANSLGDTSRTVAFSRKALEHLSGDDPITREATQVLRGIVSRNLGDAYAGKEDLDAAVRAQIEAIALSQSAGDLFEAVLAASRLGTLYELKGQLRQAARTYREALRIAAGADGQPLSVSALVHMGLGDVLREWNDLGEAESHARQAISIFQASGQPIFLPQALALRARVQHARGDTGEALKTLNEARQTAFEQKYVRAEGFVMASQARIWIEVGHLEAADQWAAEAGLSAKDDLSRFPFRTLRNRYITLARLLAARDRSEESLGLLDRLRAAAEATGRMGGLIEVLVCQAMVQQKLGRLGEAVASLKRALGLGEPEGFVRTFADEGSPMARLLARVMKEQGARTPYTSYAVLADYVGRLMAALEPELYAAPDKPGAPQPLIDPLSDRELEVLKLLASGMSNREIGERLFVAVNTVKTHVRNIYGKLYVRNRTQATARAQELNLL